MTNEKIRYEMILNGVSMTELADKLDITDEEIVDLFNSEMTLMEKYEVCSAISDILTSRKETD